MYSKVVKNLIMHKYIEHYQGLQKIHQEGIYKVQRWHKDR